MAHHHHHESDSYFMDQICLIALGGAFGVVCLTLCFWQTGMLNRILAPQFYPYILASGITLIVMVLVRAAVVWKAAGNQPATPAGEADAEASPEHHHHHDHAGHDHGAESHAHHDHAVMVRSTGVRTAASGPLAASAAAATGAGLGAAHHHDHEGHAQCAEGCADHDHAGEHHHHAAGEECCGDDAGHDHAHDSVWTPLKCLALLAPILFYLLGLPSTIQSARSIETDQGKDAGAYAAMVAAGFQPLDQVILAGGIFADPTQGEVWKLSFDQFAQLQEAALDPDRRAAWGGKTVEVPGQFAPDRSNDHVFSLARQRMNCCAPDAIQLNINIVSREPITGFARNDWVKVTGRVEFRPLRPGSPFFNTYLVIQGRRNVEKTPPDPMPYLPPTSANSSPFAAR